MPYILIDPDQLTGIDDDVAGVAHIAEGVVDAGWIRLIEPVTLCGEKIDDSLPIDCAMNRGTDAVKTLVDFSNSDRDCCERCKNILRRITRT